MSDQPKHRPNNCRNVLQARGEPYPRSGCAVCGNGGLAGCPYDQQGLAGALALAEVRIQQLEAKLARADDRAKRQRQLEAQLQGEINELEGKVLELEVERDAAHAAKTKAEEAELAAAQELDEVAALAAHVERWHDVYVDLTNNMMTLDGVAHYVADNAMMRRFDGIDESAPTTSLARRRAEWQAEALERVAHRYGHNEEYPQYCMHCILKTEAAELRRQAEEPTE